MEAKQLLIILQLRITVYQSFWSPQVEGAVLSAGDIIQVRNLTLTVIDPSPRVLGRCDLKLSFGWSFSQFSRSVVSDSLQPHGLQHTRLSCPSPFPGVRSNSYPSNQWCHPTILSFVIPFSSCLQSFPASGSFLMSQRFSSGGQSIGASVLLMNIQCWFPLGLTGLISLLSKGLSRVFFNTTVRKHQFFSIQPYLCSNSQTHTWLLEKPYLWLCRPLLGK